MVTPTLKKKYIYILAHCTRPSTTHLFFFKITLLSLQYFSFTFFKPQRKDAQAAMERRDGGFPKNSSIHLLFLHTQTYNTENPAKC
jgi:hypothetical protein